MRRLNTFVHVDGVAYGPGSDVPPEVAEKIGAHAWESDDDQGDGAQVGFEDPATQPPPDDEPPTRSGRGSGIDAWRKFAEENGVEYDTHASRDEIIAACEAAGVVEREE
ncbi:hypothetical protein OHT52_21100 [Streptomyces sp. NBC_00247]|uniref:hypothetical protein n=1 Tax=Streptomyces sp. NBC_00247 TaxID=2975689 RepID=UPI002E2BBA63|nr:hypothetical protein [Streptomyces sp. NBC_00247]